MQCKIKTFRHRALYIDNEFEHLEFDVETQCGKRFLMEGVHTVGLIDSCGDSLDRPAQIFFYLRLAMTNDKTVQLEIEEMDMFHLKASFIWDGMEIFLKFHKISEF